jgi:hypothetical protein
MMKRAARPIILFTAALAFFPLHADSQTTTAALFKAKGYLYARYMYIGSTSAATAYSGFLAMGSFQISAFDDKVSLLYRSHHWMSFARTSSSILESPFENRHIVQTAALETNGIGLPGLKLRLGRFFPEFDYASAPVMDGGSATWDGPGFALKAALGRTVDLWNGGEDGPNLFAAFQVKVRSRRFSASAGFNTGAFEDVKRRELPAGINVFLSEKVWAEAYAAYDPERNELARAGLSLSWHSDTAMVTFLASEWRNPFDQLTLLDKSRSLTTWGLFDQAVPAVYRDIRISGSYSVGGWNLAGNADYMGGIRSGWMAGASVSPPDFSGWRFTACGQVLKTDMVEFYSIDGTIAGELGPLFIQIQSQLRTYRWISGSGAEYILDDFSEVSVEYPLARHLYASAGFGGFIRQLGNEGFKPQAEARLIFRL